MEDSKTLFCASKFSRALERIYSKFVDNLGTPPQTGSPALAQAAMTQGQLKVRKNIFACILMYLFLTRHTLNVTTSVGLPIQMHLKM